GRGGPCLPAVDCLGEHRQAAERERVYGADEALVVPTREIAPDPGRVRLAGPDGRPRVRGNGLLVVEEEGVVVGDQANRIAPGGAAIRGRRHLDAREDAAGGYDAERDLV